MAAINLPNILLAIPRNSITALGLPLALGMLSGSSSSKAVNSNWYHTLYSPPGRPRKEVFPFVWTLLYLSMGYASHVAVQALDSSALPASRNDLSYGLALYYAQLGLNCAWSPLFFSAHKTGLALVDSILMTATTCYMTKLLDGPTNGKATYFLVPYCAWLMYATYLGAGTWWLNRGRKDA